MPIENERERSLLTVDIEPELRSRIEAAAAARGTSVRDFVVSVLHHALNGDGIGSEAEDGGAWSRLSIPSFSRDWESAADAVYDDLA